MAIEFGRKRAVFEFLAVGVCTLAFAVTALSILGAMLGPNSAGSHDFVEYWASGQLLIHHANPYDAAALEKLEHSAGFPDGAPTLIMGNPPSAMLLVLPLGMVNAIPGEWLWLMLQLASLAASVHLVRQTLGLPRGPLQLLVFGFAPVLSCLLAGQISVFLLLGLVLFLRWHKSRPFFSGAALWLCLLKPHLFLPFGVVLLLWIVKQRRYRTLAGVGASLGISSAIATAMDLHIWTQYRSMMGEERIDRLGLPCISTMLRQVMYPHTFWVQALPAALGCTWAVYYFMRRHGEWDWLEHGSILILVSILVAPYSWFMDQAILIPALLLGLSSTRSRTWIAVLALMSAVIEIAAFRGIMLLSPFYLWTAPAWLLWFLIATRRGLRTENRAVPVMR